MATAKPSPKGSKKDSKTTMYVVGGVVALGLTYYLYTKMKGTSSASTTASGTDPLTGNAYTPGLGSLAPGYTQPGGAPTTTTTTTTTSSAEQKAALAAKNKAIASRDKTIAAEKAKLAADAKKLAAKTVTPTKGATKGSTRVSGDASTLHTSNEGLARWRSDTVAVLEKAGLNSSQANNVVHQFLTGTPISSAKGAAVLHTNVKGDGPLGAPPIRHGASLPIVVARPPVVNPIVDGPATPVVTHVSSSPQHSHKLIPPAPSINFPAVGPLPDTPNSEVLGAPIPTKTPTKAAKAVATTATKAPAKPTAKMSATTAAARG